jgi:hypothetical protein
MLFRARSANRQQGHCSDQIPILFQLKRVKLHTMVVVVSTPQRLLCNLPQRRHAQRRCNKRLVCRAASAPVVGEQTVCAVDECASYAPLRPRAESQHASATLC